MFSDYDQELVDVCNKASKDQREALISLTRRGRWLKLHREVSPGNWISLTAVQARLYNPEDFAAVIAVTPNTDKPPSVEDQSAELLERLISFDNNKRAVHAFHYIGWMVDADLKLLFESFGNTPIIVVKSNLNELADPDPVGASEEEVQERIREAIRNHDNDCRQLEVEYKEASAKRLQKLMAMNNDEINKAGKIIVDLAPSDLIEWERRLVRVRYSKIIYDLIMRIDPFFRSEFLVGLRIFLSRDQVAAIERSVAVPSSSAAASAAHAALSPAPPPVFASAPALVAVDEPAEVVAWQMPKITKAQALAFKKSKERKAPKKTKSIHNKSKFELWVEKNAGPTVVIIGGMAASFVYFFVLH